MNGCRLTLIILQVVTSILAARVTGRSIQIVQSIVVTWYYLPIRISWASDELDLRNARWNWFTGRNYCRKMCMDMVSFETAAEQKFVGDLMASSSVNDVHTAGRLCDKEVEGCNQTRFQPLRINGWFWASTLRMMPPTNVVQSDRFVRKSVIH